MDKENFTKNQLVEDAKEVIGYLCKSYRKDKLILVGHSWRTELGMGIINSDSFGLRIQHIFHSILKMISFVICY